jgi:hypothetical protein
MIEWQVRYAYLYARLDPAARGRVLDSIQSGYLEGFDPTEDDVRRMVRLELGEITAAEAIAEAVALVNARRRAREVGSSVTARARSLPRRGVTGQTSPRQWNSPAIASRIAVIAFAIVV